jgi:hypothetical protein
MPESNIEAKPEEIVTRKLWSSLVLVASVASAGPKGTVPRSAADQYHAHAERDGVGIGAVLLTSDRVRKTFVSDVDRCCLVIEIAFYPKKDKPLTISLDDFRLQTAGTDAAARPISARAVAATLQQKSESSRSIATTETVGVGYESGTYIDPVTGQPTKVHGVTTEAGVGVAVGPPGSQPGSSNRDRDAMEIELSEKGLPEGSASAPVAGFLYFPRSVKKKKNSPLQLEYSLGDQPVELALP